MRWRKLMIAARSCVSCWCSRLRRIISCLRHASSRAIRSASRFSNPSKNSCCFSSCLSRTCFMKPSKKPISSLLSSPRGLLLPIWNSSVIIVSSSDILSDSTFDSNLGNELLLTLSRLIGCDWGISNLLVEAMDSDDSNTGLLTGTPCCCLLVWWSLVRL
uniref:Uncharacterized protein n=1 Tax=Leersia perrieri TaxID=77586 RepID=A0A0D9XCZ7_9ORYZ